MTALAELISLRRLDLAHNRITDPTPVESLGAIGLLNLDGNPVSCDSVGKLEAAFGDNIVISDACQDRAPATTGN